MSDAVCRGSFALGTACKQCSKCIEQIRQHKIKSSIDAAFNTPSKSLAAIRELTAERDALRAAMQPSVADAAKVLLNALGNKYDPKCPIWQRVIDAVMTDRIGVIVRGTDGILIALRALSKETPDA